MADLWDFGDAEDLKPLQDSSDEEDNKADFDELSCLSPRKRRKLRQLHTSNKLSELIDLDNEENDGDKPAKQDRKANKHTTAPESDSDLDLEFVPIIKREREASLDSITMQLLKFDVARRHAFCCRAREAPLDPLILQNQALVRRFQEAAQEPILDDLTDAVEFEARQPSSHAQPAADRPQDSASDSDSDSDSDDGEEPEEEVKVVLKLQCSLGTLNLRTRTQTAMRNLFEAYKTQAKQKGWISDTQAPNIKFMFEGETLAGNETAESLDLEGDEIIEVRW